VPPVRRPAATIAVVLLLAGLLGVWGPASHGGSAVTGLLGPAGAAAAPGDPRPVYLAEQLRKDPVYVSPALARAVPADDVAELRRAVAEMPYPTFVVLAPQFSDEPDVETFNDLPNLLRDRLDRDGVYVVGDEDGIGFDVQAYGVRPRGEVNDAGRAASDSVPDEDGPAARVLAALRYLRTAETPERSISGERDSEDARFWWILGGATALGFLLPMGVAGLTPGAIERRAGRRRARADTRARREQRAPAGTEPERGAARQAAQEAVAGLARAIAEAPDPPDAALRSYDAASHVLGRNRATPVDHVGAEALANAGRAQLQGRSWRPCLFDPRHGEGVRPTRWRRGDQDATIPACAACAAAIADGRTPAVLQDRGRAYWDRDTVWARTGFGAIDDDVADIVLAGGRAAR